MLIQVFLENPIVGSLIFLSILIAIAVHEFAHAKAADELGDPTPRSQGRLTLDPRAHLDLYGTLALVFFGFGWGKPVMFDPFNLKDPRRDTAIISLAGPASNLILAVLASLLLKIITIIFGNTILLSSLLAPTIFYFVSINLMLAFFNLVPIYPLDGFKIVEGLLPEEKVYQWRELSSYGPLLLLLFILPLGGKSLAAQTVGNVVNFLITLLLF